MKLSQDTNDLLRRAVREAYNLGIANAGQPAGVRAAKQRVAEDFAIGLAGQHIEAEIERRTTAPGGGA